MLAIFKKAGKGRYHDLVSLSKIFNAVLVCPNELVLNDLYFFVGIVSFLSSLPLISSKYSKIQEIP